MLNITHTDVLIVGGGPVGLSAAIDLASRSVACLLINDRTQTAQHPKCNTTNSRSMEHFRRLGISKILRSAGLPPNVERASSYVTRYCGYEYGRLPRPYSEFPTPEISNQISQIVLEKELLNIAQQATSDQIKFGYALIGLTEHTESEFPIKAVIKNIHGQESIVCARYLIGADGASSFVRKYLNVPLIGEDGAEHRAFMGGTMLSYYIRSPDLQKKANRVPSHSVWIINAKMRGLMFAQDGHEKWVVHYQVPAGVDWRTLDPTKIIQELLFDEGTPASEYCDFEILSGGPWTGGLALVAQRYQGGRIFLAGDAAHLFTPLGGMGMNTGIGDVMNLTWKIAAHLKGWGADALLKSYEIERQPIGLRNSQFGVHCAKVMDRWKPDTELEEDHDVAQQRRLEFGKQVMSDDAPQYLTAGLQLGERYDHSPIVVADGTPTPCDRWDHYEGIVRSGSRAPHFWIKEGVSIYDSFGFDFTLLNCLGVEASTPFELTAKALGIPLKVLNFQTDESSSMYAQKMCLIRPDHHIAWVGDQVDYNFCEFILKTAVGKVQERL